MLRDYELFSNEGLAAAVLFYAEHPDEGLSEVITRIDRVATSTRADLKALADLMFPIDRYVDVRLVPVGFEN